MMKRLHSIFDPAEREETDSVRLKARPRVEVVVELYSGRTGEAIDESCFRLVAAVVVSIGAVERRCATTALDLLLWDAFDVGKNENLRV